jgi:hypothetical protein
MDCQYPLLLCGWYKWSLALEQGADSCLTQTGAQPALVGAYVPQGPQGKVGRGF